MAAQTILRAGGAAMAMAIAPLARAEGPLEVEVHAPPSTSAPKEPGVAGSVVRAERLQAPGSTASDVLRTQPGTAALETGGYGALSTASIRGATAAQTPVYVAGVRVNDDVGGAADLSLLPLWMMHRIEIYRSHAPIEAGELGIGGAIFFEPRLPQKTEVAAGAMAGSYGAVGVSGRIGARNDDQAAWVGVRYDHAKNDYPFVDDRGILLSGAGGEKRTRTNADASTLDVWAIARQGGDLTVIVNHTGREQGLPGLPRFPSAEARSSYVRDLGAVRGDAHCGTSCILTATTSAVLTHAAYDDPLGETGLGTSRLDVRASRIEQVLRLTSAAIDRLTLTPSLQGSVERLGLDTAGQDPLRAGRADARGAVSAAWRPVDALALRALASADCHATMQSGRTPWSGPADPLPAADSSCEPAGRAGVGVTHGALEVLATAGRYARIPTLAELYGVSGAVRGNAALSPEHGTSIEAGVRLSDTAGAIDLFGFRRTAADLVSYEQSSFGYVRPYNTGSATVNGLELLGSVKPVPIVTFELSATLLDPRSTSGATVNHILAYTSRLTLVPRVELRTKLDAAPLSAVAAGASYFYESSRYADAAGLVVLPEQSSLDLDAEIAAYKDRIALRARLADALDQTRMDLIGYPLPGRSIYVSAELKWP